MCFSHPPPPQQKTAMGLFQIGQGVLQRLSIQWPPQRGHVVQCAPKPWLCSVAGRDQTIILLQVDHK